MSRGRVAGRTSATPVFLLCVPIVLLGDEPGATSIASVDTLRYTLLEQGVRLAERRAWQEGPDTWRYEERGADWPRATSTMVLNTHGLPIRLDIERQWSQTDWHERFEQRGDTASWSTPADEATATVTEPAYYSPILPVHDLGVLVRALLRRPDGTLPLLPEGDARLEQLSERVVEVDGERRTVRHYAVHGLDLEPQYVWLEEDGTTFADIQHAGERGMDPSGMGAGAAGADCSDVGCHCGRDAGITILIEGTRVSAVGPDGTLAVPPGADVIDAAGRMVVPGLWDMHAHLRLRPFAPLLQLAAGVTAVRDMAATPQFMTALRRRLEVGDVLGPRVFPVGLIEDGEGPAFGGSIVVVSAADARSSGGAIGAPRIQVGSGSSIGSRHPHSRSMLTLNH